MTQIQWTKCSERMPPDDEKVIINGKRFYIAIGCALRISRTHGVYIDDKEWAPYTPEAWKELNKYARD